MFKLSQLSGRMETEWNRAASELDDEQGTFQNEGINLCNYINRTLLGVRAFCCFAPGNQTIFANVDTSEQEKRGNENGRTETAR